MAGLGVAGVVGGVAEGCSGSGSSGGVLDEHQQAVVREATARLVPGPSDDPAEVGHPGAREADVTRYIVGLLGAFAVTPPLVFAGGPFSNRAGYPTDEMAKFLPLNPAMAKNWEGRVTRLRQVYIAGTEALDTAAVRKGAKDFLDLDPAEMDAVLAANPAVPDLPSGYAGFTDLLFEHTVEGLYGVPEYGGNANLVGWHDIGFPGDVQPRGYPADQVSAPLDTETYTPTPAVEQILDLLMSTAPKPPA
jgi:hypothetical protein